MCESSESPIAAMETVEERQNQLKFTPTRMKFSDVVEERGEDRLTALPDCLLVEILSRLPSTKYAIRTGTISKRWQHIWTWVHSLIFYTYYPWSNIVSLVSKTLTQCRPVKLKLFVLFTRYGTLCESQLNSLIRYAINGSVEELKLDLWNVQVKDKKFLLEQFFFINSFFTDLKLRGCMLKPSGAISWKNLRSLRIEYEKLDEELIENISCGSPVLETLELHYCYGYKQLHITSKSVKKLVLHGYYWVPGYFTHVIEINAPNILSLSIEGGLVLRNLLLVNVISLVEANLDYTMLGTELIKEEETLKEVILNLCHVKDLKIGRFCSKILSRLEAKGFIFPSNMKYPDVTPPSSSDSDDD